MSRVFARKWYSIGTSLLTVRMEKRFRNTKEFRFLNVMMQAENQFMVTLLARLAPIPFGIQNSFFAVIFNIFRIPYSLADKRSLQNLLCDYSNRTAAFSNIMDSLGNYSS